jgi:hypothetical protein
VSEEVSGFPSGFTGVWKRDNFNNTLTFTATTLKSSSQNYAWNFISASGDSYTLNIDKTRATFTIRLDGNNLVISDDNGKGDNNWNGTWRKQQSQPQAAAEKDYILPYSGTRALADNDLRGLTKRELRLARNEIYARHGRVFQDKELQKYFDSKDWYKYLRKLQPGKEPTLTKVERSNVELIQVYEAK